MIIQLNPPLPLKTPKGEGFAHFLIDYGPESEPLPTMIISAILYWTVLITETSEIWTYANAGIESLGGTYVGPVMPEGVRSLAASHPWPGAA